MTKYAQKDIEREMKEGLQESRKREEIATEDLQQNEDGEHFLRI